MNHLPSFRRFDSGAADPGDHCNLYHHRQYLAGKGYPCLGSGGLLGSSPIAMFLRWWLHWSLGTARGHDMQWVMNAFESAVKSLAMVF
ncbi:hypothetical protein ACNKHX_25755 [Shigella flexneri]